LIPYPDSVRRFVAATCALALCTAAALFVVDHSFGRRDLWVALGTTALLAVEYWNGARYRHRRDEGESISHDESLIVAGAFLAGPLALVAAFSLAIAVADTGLGRPRLKVVFNAAKSVVAVSLAMLLLHALGGADATTAGAAAAVAAGLTFVVVNDALVAVAIALASGSTVRSILFDDVRGRLLMWTGNLSLGLLAGIAGRNDLSLLVFALAALVALHFSLWGHARARIERDRLHEQERLLRAILDAERECVMLVDRDGAITFANAAGEQLVGQRWRDVVEPASCPAIDAVVATGFAGEPTSFEYEIGERVLDASVAPIEDEFGDVTSLVAVSRDVTAERTLEEQLLQSQRLEAVGQLAGGVAHDFNNLLTAISGFSEIALGRLHEPERARAALEEVRSASDRAAKLTRQLLAFSRRQVMRPTIFDLNAVVDESESLLRRLLGEHIRIVRSLDPDGCLVEADQGQLEQVLMNLSLNARDAMANGGTLRIETERVRRGAAELVLLRVSDNGSGMDPEVAERAFEPFFTTKGPGKGTGLGLAMVYGIVTQSGGDIRIETAPGAGTTFEIALPARSATVPVLALVPLESSG
jgi:PAS domain S-box-containing protein